MSLAQKQSERELARAYLDDHNNSYERATNAALDADESPTILYAIAEERARRRREIDPVGWPQHGGIDSM